MRGRLIAFRIERCPLSWQVNKRDCIFYLKVSAITEALQPRLANTGRRVCRWLSPRTRVTVRRSYVENVSESSSKGVPIPIFAEQRWSFGRFSKMAIELIVVAARRRITMGSNRLVSGSLRCIAISCNKLKGGRIIARHVRIRDRPPSRGSGKLGQLFVAHLHIASDQLRAKN